MTDLKNPPPRPGRRRFLASAALAAATPLAANAAASAGAGASMVSAREPFYGKHQSGVTVRPQQHTYFMALNLTPTAKREDLIALLKAWTAAAAQMTQQPDQNARDTELDQPPADSGSAVGLPLARLTIMFGFGPTLFAKDGVDRYGLASQRPEALADLPRFTGDQLVPERTGGDLSIQASADDPQVTEFAVRRLVALAYGVATIGWAQTGFQGNFKPTETPRNQMGFKDGTMNVPTRDAAAMASFVWVGDEGPSWMQGGTYMVIRPIRIALEHWDRMNLGFQEQTIGRHKASGAPIGKLRESDAMDLEALDADGNPVIAENAHARLAAPDANEGAQILRRAYTFDNGVIHLAERWPPWRQATTFDAGLLFQCFQRDPRTGFSKIFEKMAKFDMLNQFTTHVGSGLFACPPGAVAGGYIGQTLFSTA